MNLNSMMIMEYDDEVHPMHDSSHAYDYVLEHSLCYVSDWPIGYLSVTSFIYMQSGNEPRSSLLVPIGTV